MHIDRRSLLLGLAALSSCSPKPTPAAAPLTVYAAASLKNALDAVNAAYARTDRAAPVSASYAASSTLARQIEEGAGADVFISADSAWMDYVARLLKAGSRLDLLTNRLALIAPAASKTDLNIEPGLKLEAALGGGRLAMAGMDVPAGRYGRAALESLGAWRAVERKVAYGENVRAALRFVAEGEAPLGVVYDTDALIEPKVKIVGLFPDGSHPPIVYPAALLAASVNPMAGSYLAYLQGPDAGRIFADFGFQRPMN